MAINQRNLEGIIMGSRKSVFSGLVKKSIGNKNAIHDDDLHQSSTISSITKQKRPRSRTNVLKKITGNETDKQKDTQYIDDLDPRLCQIWHRQSRFFDLLNEQQCSDLISDFKSHIGQKIPIVIREIPKEVKKDNSEICYEVVAGSRRLWSALYVVNQFNDQFRLKAIIKTLDDKQSAIECEKENDREELSAFERGMYYHRLIEQGVFDNQKQLSDSLNIPRTSLQELLEFGKIDHEIIDAFLDPREIKKSWGKSLNQLFSNKTSKDSILKKIDEIKQSELKYSAQKIFNVLQKAGRTPVEIPSTAKFEAITKEIKDPKTKRVAIKMERTRTNKIRVSIDNKISMSNSDILKSMENFLDECSN